MIYAAHVDTKMEHEAFEKVIFKLSPSRTASVPTIDWDDDKKMKKLYDLV